MELTYLKLLDMKTGDWQNSIQQLKSLKFIMYCLLFKEVLIPLVELSLSLHKESSDLLLDTSSCNTLFSKAAWNNSRSYSWFWIFGAKWCDNGSLLGKGWTNRTNSISRGSIFVCYISHMMHIKQNIHQEMLSLYL